MAPPPLLYAYHSLGVLRHHLWCLSTPPQCGIPTFTCGTCSRDVKIKMTPERGLFVIFVFLSLKDTEDWRGVSLKTSINKINHSLFG